MEGWGDIEYTVVKPKKAVKRKIIDADKAMLQKMSKEEETVTEVSDLAIFNLPHNATEADVRSHFGQYGVVDKCYVKLDENKRCKGFAFIGFKTNEGLIATLETNHVLLGRVLEVRFPKENHRENGSGTPRKLFIGNLPKRITTDEFRKYFEKFGELKHAYLPTPFRRFGFVLYETTPPARIVLASNHIIKGHTVNVCHPSPKDNEMNSDMHPSFRSLSYGRMPGVFPRPLPPPGPRGISPFNPPW